MDQAVIAALEVMVQQGLQPDLTLYLDMPPDVAEARLGDRARDRFEREERAFFERVRTAYLARAAAAAGRFRVIDAGAPLADVQQHLALAVDAYVKAVR